MVKVESASPPDQTLSAGLDTPLAYRAVRGGLWVVASSYWMIAFGFLANIFLTRILFPEAFGEFALAMFFAQLIRLQPRLGLGRAYAQYKGRSEQAIGTYVVLESIAAFGTVAIGLLSVPVLLWFHYGMDVVQVSMALLFAAILESFAGVGNTLFDKELHFGYGSAVQSAAFPLSYIPAFWLALHGGGVWSLVAQTFTFSILSLAGIWWLLFRKLPQLRASRWRFDRALGGQFLRFGLAVGLITLAGMLLTQLDNFFIGTFVSKVELGYYDRAYRLAQWPALLMNALLARAAFFTYARLQDDPVRLRKTLEMVLWFIVLLSMPVLLVLLITAPDLLVFLYTARWLPSTPFLRILVLFALVRPLLMNANQFFIAIGKPTLTVRYNVVQLVVLAGAGLPLTLRWGAIGTAVAVGLMLAVGIGLNYRRIWTEVGINLGRVLAVPVLIGLLVLVGYLALNRYTGLTALPLAARVILTSFYAVGAFGVLTLVVQPVETYTRLRYVWRLMTQSLPKRSS